MYGNRDGLSLAFDNEYNGWVDLKHGRQRDVEYRIS